MLCCYLSTVVSFGANFKIMLSERTIGTGTGSEHLRFLKAVILRATLRTCVRTVHMCKLTKAVKNSHGIFSAALYTVTGSKDFRLLSQDSVWYHTKRCISALDNVPINSIQDRFRTKTILLTLSAWNRLTAFDNFRRKYDQGFGRLFFLRLVSHLPL